MRLRVLQAGCRQGASPGPRVQPAEPASEIRWVSGERYRTSPVQKSPPEQATENGCNGERQRVPHEREYGGVRRTMQTINDGRNCARAKAGHRAGRLNPG